MQEMWLKNNVQKGCNNEKFFTVDNFCTYNTSSNCNNSYLVSLVNFYVTKWARKS